MKLDEFLGTTSTRLPTSQEIMAVCDEMGIRFANGKDGKPALKVKRVDKEVAVLMARLLRREPWRSQVIQARALVPIDEQRAEPPASASRDADEPEPPPDARFHFADERGRPCDNGNAVFMWCWEGGSRWYYASDNPPPAGARSCNPVLW